MQYEFHTIPFNHQGREFADHVDDTARALLWEQGCGKSKEIVDQACYLWLQQKIDCVIVVAPNGVHRNWVEDEIPVHCPPDIQNSIRAMYYQSDKATTKRHRSLVVSVMNHSGFSWFTISYDAFMTKEGKDTLINFFDRRRVFYVLDEAHNIKNPDAARTKSILKSAKYAAYRRILTGTPISQGPFDLYSQIEFLDPKFWKNVGFHSFKEYQTHFGVFAKTIWNPTAWNPVERKRTGAWISTIQSYRRLDQLREIIAPITSRVTKDEVLDLPPKLYTKRIFTMTEEQRALYQAIKEEFIAWIPKAGAKDDVDPVLPPPESCSTCLGAREVEFDGFIYPCPECFEQIPEGAMSVTALLAITRLLRLQQITSGYLPTGDEEEPTHVIPGRNPRLEILCEIIEQAPHKVIVWARFQLDITLILEALAERGIRAVRYDGFVGDDERAEAKYLFKGVRTVTDKRGQILERVKIPDEEQAKVFVANPAAGSTGLTLTEAKTVVYYTNSFKLIERLQSEDRAHRIGQDNAVLYIDLVADGTVDEKIVESMRKKHNIATEILGDKVKEWL